MTFGGSQNYLQQQVSSKEYEDEKTPTTEKKSSTPITAEFAKATFE